MKWLTLLLILMCATVSAKVYHENVSHIAEQIAPGTFSDGDFIFPGRVGIGVTNATHVLTVSGNISADYYFGDGRYLTGINHSKWNPGDGYIYTMKNISIDKSVAPLGYLDIGYGLSFADRSILFDFEDGTAGASIDYNPVDMTFEFAVAPDGNSTPVTRLKIFSNGFVGIGTSDVTHRLTVDGNIKADQFIGDGRYLTGINHSNWKQGVGYIYNEGSVSIGKSTPPRGLLDVNDDVIFGEVVYDDRALVVEINNTNVSFFYNDTLDKIYYNGTTDYSNNSVLGSFIGFHYSDNMYSVGIRYDEVSDSISFWTANETSGLLKRAEIRDGNLGIGTTPSFAPLTINATDLHLGFKGSSFSQYTDVKYAIETFEQGLRIVMPHNYSNSTHNWTESSVLMEIYDGSVTGDTIRSHIFNDTGLEYWGHVGASMIESNLFMANTVGRHVHYSGNSPLASPISSSSTSLAVGNSVNFDPEGGIIKINGEIIYYERISGNTFEGLMRGAVDTVSTLHSAGSIVEQVLISFPGLILISDALYVNDMEVTSVLPYPSDPNRPYEGVDVNGRLNLLDDTVNIKPSSSRPNTYIEDGLMYVQEEVGPCIYLDGKWWKLGGGDC